MSDIKEEKRTKVAILEIYSHHVFVHTLASILLKCGLDITIYTVPRIYKDLVPLFEGIEGNPEWVICEEKETNWHFLRRITPKIDQNHDLLFINSVQGYRIGLFYLFKNKIKTIVGAGRISEFFGIKYKLFGHVSVRRLLHHNYTRLLLQRCIPRYEAIFVHTGQARNFALEHGYKKPLIQLPFSLYKGGVSIDNKETKVLEFVVTGSIKTNCRDHMGTLDAFEKLWDKGRRDVSLTVLSSPRDSHGLEVVARMKKLKGKGYPIKFFEDWIGEAEFLEVSEKADFFLSPLNLSYYSCGELTSGIVEVVRQGKPGIYPSGYLPDPRIESSSLFYEHIELLPKVIEGLLDDRERVLTLSKNAIKNSEQYSLATVAKEFKQTLSEILS